jgi:hypothetical protein
MGERKTESASARGLHRLKEFSLAIVAGGRAWGVALGVSSVLEGYLEDWARRTAFKVTLYRSSVRSVTYLSKFCKPLDLKQSPYMIMDNGITCTSMSMSIPSVPLPSVVGSGMFCRDLMANVKWWRDPQYDAKVVYLTKLKVLFVQRH